MKIATESVNEYLENLPEDRKDPINKVREIIKENLPDGYEEQIQYGMISYVMPLKKFDDTYNGQPLALASLGNQKNHMALYLNNIYSDKNLYNWFLDEYKKTGKRIDMGKSCVRFRKLEHLPLNLVGEVVSKTSVDELIKNYKDAKSNN